MTDQASDTSLVPKRKFHRKNYFKSCLIPVYFTNDTKLFQIFTYFCLANISIKSFCVSMFFLFISISYLEISDFSFEHRLQFAAFHLPRQLTLQPMEIR